MARTQRPERDLAAITVLATLLQGPRHVYEIHRLIVNTHKDFVTSMPRRLYHAVERLERGGLISVVETSRVGNRPERTVYRLEESGRAVLIERVCRLLASVDRDAAQFIAGLTFMACVPVALARQALGERERTLHRAVLEADRQLSLHGTRIPRLLLIELEYDRARLAAELTWVRARLTELDSGSLSWPDDIRALMPIEAALDDPNRPEGVDVAHDT